MPGIVNGRVENWFFGTCFERPRHRAHAFAIQDSNLSGAVRRPIMHNRTLTCLIFLFILGFASPLGAQSSSPIQYIYDPLGRLTKVVDPSGNIATYNYDAVGNLLSITRSTASPAALAIFSFAPVQGSVGQTVTIQGQNFSTTPGSNAVQF